jgi:hypothetical protein
MTGHPLAGFLSVEASAERIRRYRYVEERVMRMLGGWIALTPELTAKLLLGRHVWDCAQHADLWGKRLLELRSPAHESAAPGGAFARLVAEIERPDAFHETPERLAGVYRVLKPHLLATYEAHLVRTNPVYEPPTRRILQRCIDEERRHIAAGATVLRHLVTTPEIAERVARRTEDLGDLLERAAGITGDGSVAPASAAEPEALAEVGQDLVALEKPLGRWPIPVELETAVTAHGRAILSGDRGALDDLVLQGAASAVLPVCIDVSRSAPLETAVVACARIGAYWVVKQRVRTGRERLVLQTRWVPVGEQWRIAEAEVARREPGS